MAYSSNKSILGLLTKLYICDILLYLHLIEKHNFILVNWIVYNLFVNDSLLCNLIDYRIITHDIFFI